MQASSARPRPTGNLELYGWFFMRISAIALFVLAGFHLFYMHVILGVDAINFQVIAQRWESPFWRLYDLFLLIFGWLHATNGLRVVLDDYIRHPGGRLLAKSVLYIVGLIIFVLGAYVILTFTPSS